MSHKDIVKKLWAEKYPREFPGADPAVMPLPGAVAVSRAGRDKYRAFIILEVLPPRTGERSLRVTVADGKLRSVAAPKLKSLSHLIPVAFSSEACALIRDNSLTDKKCEEILKREWYGANISIDL